MEGAGLKRTEMRLRRRAVGLSQEQLAFAVGVSARSVGNWESGTSKPHPRHRRPLAKALEISTAEVDRIIEGLHDGGIMPRWMTMYVQIEQAADAQDALSLMAIPALLQTRTYATAAEEGYFMPSSPSEIMERVDMRMSRQAALSRRPNPQLYRSFMPVHVLDHMGSGPVVDEQIAHITCAASLDNVEMRLIEPTPRLASLTNGSCSLLRSTASEVAVEEGIDGLHYHESPSALERFRALFGVLDEIALSTADSLSYLSDRSN